MKRFFPFLISIIFLFFFAPKSEAAICKKNFQLSIKMDDDWYKKEELRAQNEEVLLEKYSEYISKKTKPLKAEAYHCKKGEVCDKVKNCQMEKHLEKDVSEVKEIEYSMKIDIGIVIAKSYCSVIGKCIGYNDFFHTDKVTAAEDRLIDIKKDNAVFYHYFYSSNSNSYEAPFNITNFHTGSELYLNDAPHFSPDEKTMIEFRSIAKQESKGDFPTGFNINIYEMNKFGEYKNIEPAETDPEDPKKVISTFLSRNPTCGDTPHFHSWKSNKEVRLSSLPPSQANEGRKVILSYDKQSKKWGCQEDLFPEMHCESYLPISTKFTSNLAEEQIKNCQ